MRLALSLLQQLLYFKEINVFMGYFRRTVIGISWVTAFRVFSRIVTFVRIIVLARILTPMQFGVFGIASLVLSFLEVMLETGINVFLIQEKDDIDKFVNAAWVVSILRGVILFLLIIFMSPLIVMFFKTPAAYHLLFLISIVPLIRGFINPSIVKLQKELQFKKEFFLRGTVFTVDSLIAIVLAFATKNATSFVWGLIAGAILEVILSFIFLNPIPRFSLSIDRVKKIIHKGKWVTAYGIFQYIAQEGDNVVVGKLLGMPQLGIYQIAYKFSTLPISEITDVVSKVVFPVYSKISMDLQRLRNAFLKTSLFISFGIIPLGFIIFFFPKEIVTLFLGDKWIDASSILPILAVYGMLRAIFGSSSALFLAAQRQDFVALMTFIRFIGLSITIIPLTFMYGLIGASYAALISVLIEIPVIVYFIFLVFRKNKK